MILGQGQLLRAAARVVGCALMACGLAAAAGATTALHRGGASGDSITVDGSTLDFASDEALMQSSSTAAASTRTLYESRADSRWGANNELLQVHLTWDRDSVYVGVDGVSWGNNVLLLFDTRPGGLAGMSTLNAWRRNFFFCGGFQPDLFLATWDTNRQPQMWRASGSNSVRQLGAGEFLAAASFQQADQGKGMEAAIPWSTMWESALLGYNAAVRDSMPQRPGDVFREIRCVAVLTGGGDGTSGPDVIPDNLEGMVSDGSQAVTLDNYLLTTFDDDGDGFPDFGVSPRERTETAVPLPVLFGPPRLADVTLDRAAFCPSLGQSLTFALHAAASTTQAGAFTLSSTIYDMRGHLVRTLYDNNDKDVPKRGERCGRDPSRKGDCVTPSPDDVWDGRDRHGALVPPGLYVLRVVGGGCNALGTARIDRGVAVVR